MPEQNINNLDFAIIGREDAVSAFKSLGFNIYPVTDSESVKDAVGKIASGAVKICLIEETFYIDNTELFMDFKEKTFPIFIPFSNKDSKGSMEELVKEIRLKATGKI